MGAVIESLGWAGAIIVLVGYLLFSAGRLPNGPAYQLLNLVGGVFVCINVFAHHAWPSTIVNGIWAIIAAVVLVRMWRARRRTPVERRALPVTTAVLPVIGPAMTQAEEPTHEGTPEPMLERTPEPTRERPHEPAPETAPGLRTGLVSMVDSVPVITAAIAVVLASTAAAHAATHAAAHEAAQPAAADADDPHTAEPRTIDA